MEQIDPTRRQFLRNATMLGVGASISGCAGLRSTAIQTKRTLGANDRIQCGFIGIGKRTSSILGSVLKMENVDVTALADVYDASLENASSLCSTKNATVRAYIRFEELLEKETLDAVVIGTPDHIHMPAILAALDRGLDIYTEKPMTLTWEEAEKVQRRANETGAVIQVGTQLRSMPMYHQAREIIQSGGIGKLVEVQVNRHSGGGGLRPLPPGVDESNVHWDLFLRDTKAYPFDLNRFINWRRFVEYSNGPVGDFMMHHLDICHFITECGMPERVMAVGGVYHYNDGRTCPDTISALVEYPEKFHFNYTTTYANGHYGLTERYLGTEGTLEVRGMSEMSIFKKDSEKSFTSPGIFNEPHLEDFFQCMRSRKKTIAPVEAGFMGATCCHMVVVSEQTGKAVTWDAVKGRITV